MAFIVLFTFTTSILRANYNCMYTFGRFQTGNKFSVDLQQLRKISDIGKFFKIIKKLIKAVIKVIIGNKFKDFINILNRYYASIQT